MSACSSFLTDTNTLATLRLVSASPTLALGPVGGNEYVVRCAVLLAILLVESVDDVEEGGGGYGAQSAYFFLLRSPPLINLLSLPSFRPPSKVPTDRREASEPRGARHPSVGRAPT